MNDVETLQRIDMLEDEITGLRAQIRDHGTGHIHTTIRTLEDRVTKLRESLVMNEQIFLSEGN